MNGKTLSETTLYISAGASFLKRDQRRSCCLRLKIGFSIGRFNRFALASCTVCRSSSRLMKSKYVICSITSSGLAMPPAQNASHSRSTFDLSSPVIITLILYFDRLSLPFLRLQLLPWEQVVLPSLVLRSLQSL